MLGTLSPEEIEALLHAEVVARVGCHANGQTYVVPITYVYDGANLIGQSVEGRKLQMMRANPSVCVEVDRVTDLANWQSVIGWGHYEELHGDAAEAALGMLRARFRHVRVSETGDPAHRLRPGETETHGGDGHLHVYRIRLYDKTGRFERT
jgi:nitroimidazol reductase NimA-like FMN-containing flavoprotein (pyridoxamine 5'-phosphate oxidase superfamily)